MYPRWLLAGCIVLVAQADGEPGHIFVDPHSGHFVDTYGRVRIFHGVNAVLKVPPWLPQTDHFTSDNSLDAKTMDLLQEWGFNVVRLGVMWPGVEPEPGQVDQGYLQRVRYVVDELKKRGIHTLADLHQDLGSRYFCGEGFPEAYVEELLRDPSSQMSQVPRFPHPFPDLPRNESGVPSLQGCLQRLFSEYYSTYQVGALFAELYRSGSRLQDGFLRFWTAISNEFKDDPNLLGYELLNEPSGTCLKAHDAFACRLSGHAMPVEFNNKVEAYYLTPLYQAAARAIRETGAKQVIFYEGTVWPKVGADVFPGPALGAETQQALAYHIYCQPGDGDNWPSGLVCDAAQEIFERTYYPFLHKYQMPGFMTEFGAVGGNKNEMKHITNLLDAADKHFQSWSYWQLKTFRDFTTSNTAEAIFTPDGQVEINKLSALSRTYAPAIAGRPLKMEYDSFKRSFVLDYVATVKEAPTEIYLNEDLHFPGGYSFVAAPPGCLSVRQTRRNWLHLHLAEVKCMGLVMQIRIYPSPQTMV
ncbi:Endoglycoceramidase (EGCase) (Glycosphingolipid-specific enzyme) (GSL-specific enzyme) [Durusdinium trenchii]|uniref:Endoglycoceramidase (EGCase) (Glycosphingolipid-specific enzyme) (GSL-specific enzyme) n=1 Tax=Durusdinium trenchii TaxID=1381693 RepID=A0ABP0MBK5_9DINO